MPERTVKTGSYFVGVPYPGQEAFPLDGVYACHCLVYVTLSVYSLACSIR